MLNYHASKNTPFLLLLCWAWLSRLALSTPYPWKTDRDSCDAGCWWYDDSPQIDCWRISPYSIFCIVHSLDFHFDSPVFTIVDRGRNLTNEYIASHLKHLRSQLYPIATEASLSIRTNERSHGFILELFTCFHRAVSSPTMMMFIFYCSDKNGTELCAAYQQSDFSLSSFW